MSSSKLNYHYLSDAKYFTAFALGVSSCTLSVLGSTVIIYLILRRQKWKSSLFQRIVLGLSVSDILGTLSAACQPFMLPKSTKIPIAFGNTTTCEAIGFLFMSTMASYLYSCELSVYFLLSIRYDWREAKTSSYLEPWVHVLPWIVPLSFGTAAIILDAYNPSLVLGICMFGSYPADCHVSETIECVRGDRDAVVYGLFVPWNFISGFAALIGISSTWLVYSSVRRQIQRNHRYDFRRQSATASGVGMVVPVIELSQQDKRLRAVSRQAIFYTLAFLNTFIGACFGSIMGFFYTESGNMGIYTLDDKPFVYAAVLFLYAFFPLQGFLNALVYVRPILIRWKDANQNMGWLFAFRQVLSCKTPPLTARTAHLARSSVINPRGPSYWRSEPLDLPIASRTNEADSQRKGEGRYHIEGNVATAVERDETETENTT